MKYLHAIKGSLIAFVVFVLLMIFLPAREPILNIDLVLTVSTFLFAILAGFFILLIVRDLQNLKLGGYALSIESGQEVLEAIGQLRYYSESLIKDGIIKIPETIDRYRVKIAGKGKKSFIKVVYCKKGTRP